MLQYKIAHLGRAHGSDIRVYDRTCYTVVVVVSNQQPLHDACMTTVYSMRPVIIEAQASEPANG